MRAFLDSSALAKRYLEEPGSDEVEEVLAETTSLGLSVICLPEIISALCRRHREASITERGYRAAKQALLDDVRDAEVINITPDVVKQATVALETNVLRAMDALHLGCALEWGAELFVSADERQVQAAENCGLATRRA